MDAKNVNIDDEVEVSPVGPGKVTGFTADGYPQVNGLAVGYFTRTDGKKYGAFGDLDTPGRKMEQQEDSATKVEPMGLHSMGGKTAPVVEPGFKPQGGTSAPPAAANEGATGTPPAPPAAAKPADVGQAPAATVKPAAPPAIEPNKPQAQAAKSTMQNNGDSAPK